VSLSNKHNPPHGYVEINCDRNSALGNPFNMKNESITERDRVCDEFDAWFEPNLNNQRKAELIRIETIAKTNNVALVCWCAPKRCHCTTIKRVLDKRLGRNKTLF
jgi:hypothetical protein